MLSTPQTNDIILYDQIEKLLAKFMRKLPSLKGLYVFEVVSRHLNFRLAADELGVTQAAVAQQIRGLEEELGLKLFERTPRKLTMTESAYRYAISVKQAFKILEEATEILHPTQPYLTISVPPSFAAKWLLPRLNEFAETYPDLDLRVVASPKVQNFGTDGIDLAIRLAAPPFENSVNADLLFENQVVAVANPLLIEKIGHPHDSKSLQSYTLIHDAHNFWPKYLQVAFPDHDLFNSKNIYFNQTSLAIDSAIAGQGIALTCLNFVKDDLEAGRLIRLNSITLDTGSGFYLISLRKPHQPPSLPLVKSWLMNSQ